jgi:hypothetical protein
MIYLWQRDSQKRLGSHAERIKSNLRAVATAIAQQERVGAVSARHVDDAYQALARVGLRVAPWYKRTEVEAAIGGMLVSFSLASPDIVGVFIPGASGLRLGVTAGILLSAMTVGCFLFVDAFLKGNLPRVARSPLGRIRWKCWPWNECIYESHSDAPPYGIAKVQQ